MFKYINHCRSAAACLTSREASDKCQRNVHQNLLIVLLIHVTRAFICFYINMYGWSQGFCFIQHFKCDVICIQGVSYFKVLPYMIGM